MKLGILLVIVGGIIVSWFFALPLAFGFWDWVDRGVFSVNWTGGGWGIAVGILLGAVPFTIGQERIKKARSKRGGG